MKDPLGMLVGLIGEYNLLRSVLVMSLDGVLFPGEGVTYCGFLSGVLLTGENFPPLGKNCLYLSYDLLGIEADSTLEGVLSTPLGKFHFATLERTNPVSWTHEGVLL